MNMSNNSPYKTESHGLFSNPLCWSTEAKQWKTHQLLQLMRALCGQNLMTVKQKMHHQFNMRSCFILCFCLCRFLCVWIVLAELSTSCSSYTACITPNSCCIKYITHTVKGDMLYNWCSLWHWVVFVQDSAEHRYYKDSFMGGKKNRHTKIVPVLYMHWSDFFELLSHGVSF